MSNIEKLDMGDLMPDIFRLCNQEKPFLVKMMAHLQKEFFPSKLFGLTYTLYKVYFEKYEQAPTEKIFKNEMVKFGEDKNTVDNLAKEIYNTPILNVGEKEYITDLVVMHARKQRMKQAIEKGYDTVEDGDFTDEKFNTILTEFKDSVKFSIDTDLGADLFDIDERYNKLAGSMGQKISTGYDQIDMFTGGGLSRKELVAIQAPPGIGKCGFFNNIVEIEIDENDPLYEKVRHLIEK